MMEALVDAGPLLDVIFYRDKFSVPLLLCTFVRIPCTPHIVHSHHTFRFLPF